MQKLTGALAALAVTLPLAQQAAAADLPLKAPPLVVVYNWTGFYAGANVGYSWGRADTDVDGTFSTITRTRTFRTASGPIPPLTDVTTGPVTAAAVGTGRADVDGVLGGFQIGYNWQVSRSWVIGVETDIQLTGERGSSTVCVSPTCLSFATADTKLKWFGTLRGRVGYLIDPRVMIYATGGLAYGEVETNYGSVLFGQAATLGTSSVRVGWTGGGGIEAMLDNNWSIKAEYLFTDYGRVSGNLGAVTNVTSTTTANVPSVGFSTIVDTTTTLSGPVSTRFTDQVIRIGINYRFAPSAIVARY